MSNKKKNKSKKDNIISKNIQILNNELTTLSDTNENITHIVHISDIHIKSNRKIEYEIIFNKLYQNIEEHKKNHPKLLIVITGDICHDCKLDGTEIDMLDKFLTSLCKLSPVIAINGNHDIVKNDPYELTYILPLTRNKNTLKEFHLLIHEGMYKYNNIIFGLTNVFSKNVFKIDDKVIKSNNITNFYKIALYHGHVASKQVKNIIPTGSYFKVEDFDDYDFGLFGDIHQHCFVSDNKFYSGSLIQQNWGECLEKGYVLVDLVDKQHKFIQIPNDYGYVTLIINENGIINNNLDYPKYAKFNAYYKNITYNDAVIFLKEIEEKYNTIIKPQQDLFYCGNLGNSLRLNNDNNNTLDNLKNKKGIEETLLNYIKNKYTLNNNITYIKICIKMIMEKININNNTSSRYIKLIKLKFNNFFSYGENNEIEFENLKGIILIDGKNGQGKSAIFDAILESIVGNCSRGLTYDKINYTKDNLMTDITLQVNDDIYRIVRKRSIKNNKNRTLINNKKNNTDINEIDIYKNNKLVNNLKNYNQKNDYIKNNICSYDDLINTCFIMQNTFSNFLTISDNDKRSMLLKYLDLDIFETIKTISKNELENYKKITKNMTTKYGKNLNKYQNDLQNQIKLDNDKLDEFNKKLELIEQDYNKYNKSIIENELKIQELSQYTEFIEKTDKIKSKLINYKKIYNDKLLLLDNYNLKLNEELNKKNNLENLKDKYKNILDEHNKFLSNKKQKLNNLNNELLDVYKKIINIKKPIYNIKTLNKLIQDDQNKINILNKELLDKQILINNIIIHPVKNINNLELKINKYNKISKSIISINDKIKLLLEDNKINNIRLDKLKTHEYNINCSACMKNQNTIDLLNYSNIINNNNKLIKEKQLILDKKNNILKELEKYIEMDKLNKINEENKIKINDLEKEIILIRKNIELLEINISNNKNKKNENNEYNKVEKDNKIYRLKVENIKFDINKIELLENEEYNNYLKYTNSLIDIEKNIIELKNKINNMEINKYLDNINKCEKELEEIKINLEKVELYEKLTKELDIDIIKFNKIKEEKNKINSEIILLKENIMKQNIYLENFNKELEEYKLSEQKEEGLSIIYNSLANNGLINELFNNHIFPKLQEIVNNILKQITNFTIVMNCDGINKINIKKIYSNNVKTSLDTYCGSEKSILDIIFRIALCKFNNYIKSNFFIMDENTSYLDSDKIDILTINLYTYLKKYFDYILVVSHMPQINEVYDKKIKIKMIDGYSKILY